MLKLFKKETALRQSDSKFILLQLFALWTFRPSLITYNSVDVISIQEGMKIEEAKFILPLWSRSMIPNPPYFSGAEKLASVLIFNTPDFGGCHFISYSLFIASLTLLLQLIYLSKNYMHQWIKTISVSNRLPCIKLFHTNQSCHEITENNSNS